MEAYGALSSCTIPTSDVFDFLGALFYGIEVRALRSICSILIVRDPVRDPDAG